MFLGMRQNTCIFSDAVFTYNMVGPSAVWRPSATAATAAATGVKHMWLRQARRWLRAASRRANTEKQSEKYSHNGANHRNLVGPQLLLVMSTQFSVMGGGYRFWDST